MSNQFLNLFLRSLTIVFASFIWTLATIGFHDEIAFASELCGPKVVAERFVQVKEDLQLTQELRLKHGGLVRRKTEYRKSPEGNDLYTHTFEIFDASNILSHRKLHSDKPDNWRILGAYPSGSILVSTGNHLGGEIFVLDKQGDITIRYSGADTDNLINYEEAVALLDGDLLLLGSHESVGAAVKFSESEGVVWKTHFFPNWLSVYPNKAIQLGDGTVVFIGNGYAKDGDDTLLNQTGAVRIGMDGELLWSRQYTNGFDDELSDVVLMPDETLMFAGVTRLADRYDGNKYFLWLFKTDVEGVMREERLIFESQHSVGSQDGNINLNPSGEVSATWPILGPNMHDLQHQECTYRFENSDTYRPPM